MKEDLTLKDLCPEKNLTAYHSDRKALVKKLKSSGIPKWQATHLSRAWWWRLGRRTRAARRSFHKTLATLVLFLQNTLLINFILLIPLHLCVFPAMFTILVTAVSPWKSPGMMPFRRAQVICDMKTFLYRNIRFWVIWIETVLDVLTLFEKAPTLSLYFQSWKFVSRPACECPGNFGQKWNFIQLIRALVVIDPLSTLNDFLWLITQERSQKFSNFLLCFITK